MTEEDRRAMEDYCGMWNERTLEIWEKACAYKDIQIAALKARIEELGADNVLLKDSLIKIKGLDIANPVGVAKRIAAEALKSQEERG